MNDLYDNLEDYNDVNALADLRAENQELKRKLEESTLALGNIQKDYDKLALEFKKLEMNYSSLLKTARAEIERKTLIITNLNTEKDMIVLKSLQNGNDVRRNSWRGRSVNRFKNTINKTDNKEITEENIDKDETTHTKPTTSQNTVSPIISSSVNSSCPKVDESVTNYSNDDTKRSENNGPVEDNCIDKKSEFKENLRQSSKLTAGSIQNRRKSMPVLCSQEKFSSDEEPEHNNKSKAKEVATNDVVSNNTLGHRLLERLQSDRCSNKTSETLSTEDQHFNHRDPREPYRTRVNKHYDRDNHRSNKYPSNKYNSYGSDNSHRYPRGCQDDYRHRAEFGRQRILVSPPPNSYHNSQRRSRDHRSNYDRYHKEFDRHNDYNRNRFEAKQPNKHKMTNDYEGPSHKRQRIEFNSARSYPDDERRYNKELPERTSHTRPHEHDIDHKSCQSPDQITEGTASPIIEKKNRASISLEDPRLANDNYVVKTNADGRINLSTVTGRNVDIIPIDAKTWDIERIEMPHALTHNPSHITNDIVDEIYMDGHKQVMDISMEPGELADSLIDYPSDFNPNKGLDGAVNGPDINKHTTEYTKLTENIRNVENVQTPSFTKYRIPKLSHDKNTPNDKESRIQRNPCEAITKTIGEYDNKRENKIDNHRNSGRLIDRHDKVTSTKKVENVEDVIKSRDASHEQIALSTKAMIEGDLELSDEASDVGEHSNYNVKEYEKRKLHISDNVGSGALSDNHASKVLSVDKSRSLNSRGTISATCEKTMETDDKKHKSKKKRSKSKDNKDAFDKVDVDLVLDKKTKSKKEKEPKEFKNKLTDLFGDTSSSLIMPEDLGISTYVPMFEDAQDAVDLNIKQIIRKSSQKNDTIGNLHQSDFQGVKSVEPSTNKHSESTFSSQCNKVQNVSMTNDIQYLSKSNAPRDLDIINAETVTDNNDIVKTFVISTGVQPQFSVENNVQPVIELPEDVMPKPATRNIGVSSNLAINQFKKRECMKALATSTPQKDFIMKPSATEIIETGCKSNMVRADSLDSIPSVVDHCETNTLDSQSDVPDVRIILKRRRKVMKKPPMG